MPIRESDMALTDWRLRVDSFVTQALANAFPNSLPRHSGGLAGYATELESKTIQVSKTPILMAMFLSARSAGVVAEVAVSSIENAPKHPKRTH